MQINQKAEFGARILAIGLFYEKEITKVVIDLYWEALKDLELCEIEKALQIHIKDPERGRFMPKPADLRGIICNPVKTPLIAWRTVESAYRKFNYYDTVQFENGVTNAVIKDLGGWIEFSQQNLDEPWTQKEFERRYEAYAKNGIESHEPLPGFHEINNRDRGYLDHIPECKLIADSGQITMLPPRLPQEQIAAPSVKLLAEKIGVK
jgi:hypothetical protein